MSENEVVPSHQALAALQTEDVDIRPRFWDKLSDQWVLVDTGAQVSVCAPGANDKIDPRVTLETVDGSKMPSYGSKDATFRLGRKEYHQKLHQQYVPKDETLGWAPTRIAGHFSDGVLNGIALITTNISTDVWATVKNGVLHGPCVIYGISYILNLNDCRLTC